MDPCVVVTGNIVLDTIVRPVDEVAWGTTRWVDSIAQHLGGNGANTSYALAKLGVRTRLAGWVGPDSFGDQTLAKLTEGGVDIRFVARSEEPTAASVVLVRSDGQRAFLHRPGVSRVAFSDPLDFNGPLGDDATHYHLANPFGFIAMRRHAPEMLRRAKARGMTTSLDTAWDSRGEWNAVIDPCLEHVDILFMNEIEAERLGHPRAPVVVRKLEAAGCEVNGERVAGFDVVAVDSTGAGDCFAGAFLAAHLRGASLLEAARFANAVGAMVVSQVGAVTGVRDYASTRDWMRAK